MVSGVGFRGFLVSIVQADDPRVNEATCAWQRNPEQEQPALSLAFQER